MKRLLHMLSFSIGVAVLLVTIAVSGSGSAVAQEIAKNVQNVLIVNTPSNPVPVSAQGTTTVAGTVKLDPASTVKLDPNASTVTVANTASAPVPVRHVNPVPQPFQRQISFTIADGQYAGYSEFAVPSGYHLVLEFGSGSLTLGALDQAAQWFGIATTASGSFGWHYVPVTPVRNGQVIASQPLRVHADPGSRVSVSASRLSTVGTAHATLTVSGHLVPAQ